MRFLSVNLHPTEARAMLPNALATSRLDTPNQRSEFNVPARLMHTGMGWHHLATAASSPRPLSSPAYRGRWHPKAPLSSAALHWVKDLFSHSKLHRSLRWRAHLSGPTAGCLRVLLLLLILLHTSAVQATFLYKFDPNSIHNPGHRIDNGKSSLLVQSPSQEFGSRLQGTPEYTKLRQEREASLFRTRREVKTTDPGINVHTSQFQSGRSLHPDSNLHVFISTMDNRETRHSSQNPTSRTRNSANSGYKLFSPLPPDLIHHSSVLHKEARGGEQSQESRFPYNVEMSSIQLPPPRQIRMFIDYVRPMLRRDISNIEIQFIVNQWHLFRQSLRHNRRKERLRQIQRVQGRRLQSAKSGAGGRAGPQDIFSKVLLKSEAIAVQQVTSYEEFKRTLLGGPQLPREGASDPVTKADKENEDSSRNRSRSHGQIKKGLPRRPIINLPQGGAVLKSSLVSAHLPLVATSSRARPKPVVGATSQKRRRSVELSDQKLLGNANEEGVGMEENWLELSPDDDDPNHEQDYKNYENVQTTEAQSHSDSELRNAYFEYREFVKHACSPQNRTLCTQSLLGMEREKATLFLPPGVYVKRCNNPTHSTRLSYAQRALYYSSSSAYAFSAEQHQRATPLSPSCVHPEGGYAETEVYGYENVGSCSCPTPGEECLPTKVALKMHSVALVNTTTGKVSTELIALTEHLECGCRSRCSARLCVPPLQLVEFTADDCSCACPEGDTRCEALLDGITAFTEVELPIPLNGSFILPPCHFGAMDDQHLYYRRCPGPMG